MVGRVGEWSGRELVLEQNRKHTHTHTFTCACTQKHTKYFHYLKYNVVGSLCP